MKRLATVILVLLSGCAGPIDGTSDTGSRCAPAETSGDETLLSKQAALACIGIEDGDDTSATLYVIAGDGTWYRAAPDGERREPAPNGSDTIIGGREFTLNESTRPVYVWKITVEADLEGEERHGAAQYLVDAETGHVIREIVMP